jgi:hypothetical protein
VCWMMEIKSNRLNGIYKISNCVLQNGRFRTDGGTTRLGLARIKRSARGLCGVHERLCSPFDSLEFCIQKCV